jgi:hypothetical protein
LLKPLEEKPLNTRLPTTLEIILVQLYDYSQMLIPMLIQYLHCYEKLHPKRLRTSFLQCLRKWVDIIQTNLAGTCRF